VRVAELSLPLGKAEAVPVVGGYPVGSCQVGCGLEVFELDEFGEVVGTGGEGDDAVRARGEVDYGKHFAADGFVADPEEQVIAPLQGFGDVGEREEKGAGSLGIHAEEYRLNPPIRFAYGWGTQIVATYT
jgi:hypothetical protein